MASPAGLLLAVALVASVLEVTRSSLVLVGRVQCYLVMEGMGV